MEENREIAAYILDSVGGSKNIKSVVHCATRLRFVLNDESKADTKNLQSNEGIIQVVQSGGQYQVVVGSHVGEVYQELMTLADFDSDDRQGKSGSILNRFVDIISAIFTPFLGALAGAGVLKGFLMLALTLEWVTENSGIYTVLFSIADGVFTYLPVILALTAAQKFKTNPYLAIALGMALVHPIVTEVSGQTLSFFGLPVVIGPSGYTSSVIPIILAVYVQSYVERYVKKVVPTFLSTILVPLLIFLIMAPITFIVIGPIGTVLGELLGQAYYSIYNFSPMIAGAAMGGFWQVFVIFGMHWGFIPIMAVNVAQGSDTLIPILLPAILAQGGAALAVFFRTKSMKLKSLAISATITSLFGITEPTVYGVTLPLKKPFIAGCIGGAVGGAFIAVNQVQSFIFSLISLLSLPGFIPQNSQSTSGMLMAIIGTAIAFALAFILTFVFRFEGLTNETNLSTENVITNRPEREERFALASPLEGEIIPLADVSDQVFASEALGKGVAVQPTVGKLHAPADGIVSTVFSSGNAIAITTFGGVELLIHIGINTASLEGNGFKTVVEQEDKVKKGELLMTFDMEKIQAAGLSTISPIVITNTQDYLDVLDMNQTEIVFGEELLMILPQS